METLYKYPRTPHLPWSEGITDDDEKLADISHFEGKRVIVTLKMDGECTTMTREKVYARSLDSVDHPSRHWVKGLHAGVKYLLPFGWRICGENLYAKHSIYYDSLPSFFMVYSIWDSDNRTLGVNRELLMCEDSGLCFVPIIWNGIWKGDMEKLLADVFSYCPGQEGYVVRLYDSFHFDNFATSVAKWVRKDHVQTDKHWMHQTITPNKLGI